MTAARARRGTDELLAIARERFGYERFRPGQREAIEAVLAGRDALAVMPTGAGKSAIYQIAALEIPGSTVIVSPLLALQRDQLQAIASADLPAAAAVSSAVGVSARREAFSELKGGHLEFLFLSPEQFRNPEVLAKLKAARPSLFVVDEAHCISQWGHDFRPDYLSLGAVARAIGRPPVLALTATASPDVRCEIVARLGMERPRVVVRGFDRPNIRLEVRPFENEAEQKNALLRAIARDAERPGIVYAATRRHAEEIAAALVERGDEALCYHAGMKKKEREQVQSRFVSSQSAVLVATNAFGMGIDKPDVRFVYHYDISDSLDSYYQEIGRCGRDGRPAEATLFYRAADLHLHRFFAAGGRANADQIGDVAALLRGTETLSADEIARRTGLSRAKVNTAIVGLEDLHVIERLPTGEVRRSGGRTDPVAAADEAAELDARRRQAVMARIEVMRHYAELETCRRQFLLNYFGEETDGACGRCDNCERRSEAPRVARPSAERGSFVPLEGGRPFPLQSWVVHPEFGKGVVEEYRGERIVVLFEREGSRTLALRSAASPADGNVLRPFQPE